MWFDILNLVYDILGAFLLTVFAPLILYIGTIKLFSKFNK